MIITYVIRPICSCCLVPMKIKLTPRNDRLDDVVFMCGTEGCKQKNQQLNIKVQRGSNV